MERKGKMEGERRRKDGKEREDKRRNEKGGWKERERREGCMDR